MKLELQIHTDRLVLTAPRNLLRGVRLTALDVFDYCGEHGRATITKRSDGLRELRVICSSAPRSLELLLSMIGDFFYSVGDELGIEPALTTYPAPSARPAA